MSEHEGQISDKKKLTEMQEKFCVSVASGKSLTESFILAYPKAAKWKREVAQNKGHDLSKKKNIAERINEIKHALKEKSEKEYIWTQEDSVRMLSEIAKFEDKASDRIAAIKELNSLLGLAAPKKLSVDNISSDGSMSPKPLIDATKLPDNVLKMILEARIESVEK